MSHKLIHVVLLVIALHAVGARAQEAETPLFSFNGFGTLGVAHSSENKADFTSSIFKPNGAGYSHAWSADVDSLIAVQASANPTRRLSAVLQVISEQRYDGSYRPHVEWANIKYEVTPDFSLRVGRVVLPIYMLSDTRKVGYAMPWVRPPGELYAMVPVSTNDGLDASYRTSLGGGINTIQALVGQSDSSFPNYGGTSGITAQARKVRAIVDTFEHGFTTLRLNYEQLDVTIPELVPLFDAFRQFGPEGMAIADKYEVNKLPVSVIAVGASYNPGSWFVMGEWSRVDGGTSTIGKRSAWYVSSGYRIGKFTPYVTYAQAKADIISEPGLTVSALPPFLAGPARTLNATLGAVLGTKIVDTTLSVGARWDFATNAALKLQYDHTRNGTGSPGPLINTQPGFQPGGKVNVLSATMDFVF